MKTWKKRTLIITAAVAGLAVLALAAAPVFVLPMFLGQRYEQTQHDPAEFGVTAEPLTLTTDDGLRLAAWYVAAEAPETAKGTVILLSGIQSPSVTAFFGYAKLFAGHGYNTLLVEMRARSLSEGEEIGFGMTEWRDVKAAAEYLADEGLPLIAMGTSMGAGTVIVAAAEVEAIDAVIAASPPSSVADMFTSYIQMMGLPYWVGVLETPFANLHLGLHFGFDALQYMPLNAVEKLGNRPLLLMQSTKDSQVFFWEHEKLLAQAQKSGVPVQTFIREGDNHFICYEKYFYMPWKDTEFADTLLEFLDNAV